MSTQINTEKQKLILIFKQNGCQFKNKFSKTGFIKKMPTIKNSPKLMFMNMNHLPYKAIFRF